MRAEMAMYDGVVRRCNIEVPVSESDLRVPSVELAPPTTFSMHDKVDGMSFLGEVSWLGRGVASILSAHAYLWYDYKQRRSLVS
jgi:hypothetical protein